MTDTTIKTYLVGGAVRDKQLGLTPHDMDYAVEAPSFAAMKMWLEDEGFTIFQEREEFGVIRARKDKETSDYVLCRLEGPYTDHRHPDYVTIGNIFTDLARRDFSINAMAEDSDTGELIDPYNGVRDLKDKVLRAVGDPQDRLIEDPLRAFRAIRFSVTKNMFISRELSEAMRSQEIIDLMDATSAERVREELTKAFSFDSHLTMILLVQDYPRLLKVALDKGVWFEPTTKKR